MLRHLDFLGRGIGLVLLIGAVLPLILMAGASLVLVRPSSTYGALDWPLIVVASGVMVQIDVMELIAHLGSKLAAGVLIGLVGALSWFRLTEGRAHQAIRGVSVLMCPFSWSASESPGSGSVPDLGC